MELVIYGVINSLTLALIAVGFALVYGVSRLPNFAHGALYIISGFVVWIFLRQLGVNYAVAIAASLIITALIGGVIYQVVLIRVRGMAVSEVIASFAIGLAILEFLRWVGFRGLTYVLPTFVSGKVDIAGVPVDWQRIALIGIGVGIVIGLYLFTHHTKVGLALRAIAQDERAALMLGIDSDWTAVVALALGSALAGIAAITILPLGNITIESGYQVLIYAIAVSVCGGLGSWGGAILAAFVLGFAQLVTVYYIAPHFQLVVAMLAIIFILILRPSGLFGRQKELEERV